MSLDQTLKSSSVYPRLLRRPGDVALIGLKQLTNEFVFKVCHGDGLQRLEGAFADGSG